MRRLPLATAAAVILAILLPVGAALAAVDLKKRPFDRIDDFLNLRDRLAKASDKSSWIPFKSSERENVQKEIDTYLDDALRVLSDDTIVAMKDEVKKLQAKNKQLALKISDFEILKTTAPAQTKAYQIWKDSVGDLDEKIAETEREIENNKIRIRRLTAEIKTKLAESGVALSDDQINNIFITGSGEDQLHSIVVLKNLYSLTDILKNLMQSSKNLTVSRKYYGVFLLATEAHQRQLLNNLDRIDNVYLPNLEAKRLENAALMAQTRELAAGDANYRSNLAAQKLTDDVFVKFQDLLGRQKEILLDRLQAIGRIIQYTDNTYRTVSLASGLADLMEESVSNLSALLQMPIVPPLAFDNNLEDIYLEMAERLGEN